MKLSKKEKQVLTLINDIKVESFIEFTQRYIDLSSSEIKKIVKKLLKLELIEIISLTDEKDLWYFHTKQFEKKELDEELYYNVNFGSKKPVLKASQKLEKKLK